MATESLNIKHLCLSCNADLVPLNYESLVDGQICKDIEICPKCHWQCQDCKHWFEVDKAAIGVFQCSCPNCER